MCLDKNEEYLDTQGMRDVMCDHHANSMVYDRWWLACPLPTIMYVKWASLIWFESLAEEDCTAGELNMTCVARFVVDVAGIMVLSAATSAEKCGEKLQLAAPRPPWKFSKLCAMTTTPNIFLCAADIFFRLLPSPGCSL